MTTVTTTERTAARKWLGLGKKIKATTVEEALDQGGLKWTVSKRPIATTLAIPEKVDIGNPAILSRNGTIHHDQVVTLAKRMLEEGGFSQEELDYLL